MPEYPETPKDHVVASYRYLRLAMVVLVVTLAASLVIERTRATCWQGSISAYYYTPVHAIFICALFAIGVVLVSMKGRDGVEDLFFNLAGVLAPVVALVPTARPRTLCSRPGDELTPRTTALVSNNVPAVVIGAALAIGLAYALAVKQGKAELRKPPNAATTGIVLGIVLLVTGVAWYLVDVGTFERRAHAVSAVAMFVAIWCAVMVNARWPARVLPRVYRWLGETMPPEDVRPRAVRYRKRYRAIAAFMVAAAVAIVISLPIEWEQRVFWLEALEIAPFAAFWWYQTFEAWEFGVATPAVETSA